MQANATTTRHHKILGKGTYGCVFSNPRTCKKGKVPGNFDYKNGVAKLMKPRHMTTELNEIKRIRQKLRNTSPSAKRQFLEAYRCDEMDIAPERIQEILGRCGMSAADSTNMSYIVMPNGGMSLSTFTTQHALHAVHIPHILRAAPDLFDAIVTLTTNKIVHHDIKPGNVLYNPDTHKLTLIDFGLARTFGAYNKHGGEYWFNYPPESIMYGSTSRTNTLQAITVAVGYFLKNIQSTSLSNFRKQLQRHIVEQKNRVVIEGVAKQIQTWFGDRLAVDFNSVKKEPVILSIIIDHMLSTSSHYINFLRTMFGNGDLKYPIESFSEALREGLAESILYSAEQNYTRTEFLSMSLRTFDVFGAGFTFLAIINMMPPGKKKMEMQQRFLPCIDGDFIIRPTAKDVYESLLETPIPL